MTIRHDWDRIDAVQLASLARFDRTSRDGAAMDRGVPDRAAAPREVKEVAGIVPASMLRRRAHPAVGMTLGKRLFDVVLALALLVPLSVVMLVVAALLALLEGRPIFYVSERIREPGKPFALLKFRTMSHVAEDAGATGAHKAWRITPLGRFLRRTRIDELPQLFNILRGDMSFVGPRPPLREYVERFPRRYAEVLRTRPGVTGLATLIYHSHEDRIMARCHTPEATEAAYYRRCLPTKLRLDMIYQRRRTLAMDLWIIWNTVMTVIKPGWKRPR